MKIQNRQNDLPLFGDADISSIKTADIYTHSSPDGDAIGSSLAVLSILSRHGIKSRVFCEGPFPRKYSFLPLDKYNTEKPEFFSDSAFFVDCGDIKRVGTTFSDVLDSYSLKINIDHHIDNKLFGDVNIVDPSASSTAELIAGIVGTNNIEIQTAEYLYVGILSDTYGFSTSSVSSKTFMIASTLIDKGINSNRIWKEVFRLPSDILLFYAEVLRTSETEKDVIYCKVTKELMEDFSVSEEDTEGLANYLLQLKDIDTVVLLRERNGSTRLSFRSSGNKDVGALSRKFGGGGHKLASGAVIDKDLINALSIVKKTMTI